MPGPPRTPTKTLKMRGSWLAKDRDATEPNAPSKPPTCPAWLDREGRAEWKRTVGSLRKMGILSCADRACLIGLAYNWSLFVKTAKLLNHLEIDTELMEARRLASICSDAYRNYSKACADFGLNPAARSRVVVKKKPKSDGGGGRAQYFVEAS